MWNYFIPFAAGLLQNKNPLEAGRDAAISGTVGDIAGNFGSALDATSVVGPVADPNSYSSLLRNSKGITDAGMSTVIPATTAGYTGPTSMMQNLGGQLPQNIPFDMTNTITQSGKIMPSYMDTTGLSYDQIAEIEGPGGFEPYVTTGRTTNLSPLTERTDVPQTGPFNIGPDMSQVTAPDPQDIAKAGGYEEVPLYKQAADKVMDYIKDKPLESAFMAATIGGSLYEGFKPKQTQVAQAPLGPQLGGKQYSGGGNQLLKVRRPR